MVFHHLCMLSIAHATRWLLTPRSTARCIATHTQRRVRSSMAADDYAVNDLHRYACSALRTHAARGGRRFDQQHPTPLRVLGIAHATRWLLTTIQLDVAHAARWQLTLSHGMQSVRSFAMQAPRCAHSSLGADPSNQWRLASLCRLSSACAAQWPLTALYR